MPKHFVVFAERFEHGTWNYWEHECDKEDIPALEDSATAYAFSRTHLANIRFVAQTRRAHTPMLLIRSMNRITELHLRLKLSGTYRIPGPERFK
jgi:hypothetical protein